MANVVFLKRFTAKVHGFIVKKFWKIFQLIFLARPAHKSIAAMLRLSFLNVPQIFENTKNQW